MWSIIGGSGTIGNPSSTFTSITGLGVGNNTFRWTISNGVCLPSTDDVVITRDANPTTANAGPDQTVCSSTDNSLAGNTPAVGSGMWSIIGGSGAIVNPSSAFTSITGLGLGSNTFRWTISNGVCPSSTDDVVITRNEIPTTANAGPDQTVCATTDTLAGNTPTVGSGTWILWSGSGAVTTPTSPTSFVTGLGVGNNTFRWRINNGPCISDDFVTISRDANPSTANAGPNQTICSDTAEVDAALPAIGNGIWTLIGGTGTIVTPNSTFSSITGVGFGSNTFRWTVSNGVCPPSTDDLVITRDGNPATANAGADQTVPVPVTNLNGNSPGTGSGLWTVVSGAGTFLVDTLRNSIVTGMNYGLNRFSWTISGTCAPGGNSDTVDITYDCIANITLNGSFWSGTYQVDSSLSLIGIVPSPNIVTGRAGFEVTLDDFEVELGAEFNAIIGPCGSFLMEDINARSGKTNKDKEDAPDTNVGILQLEIKQE